MANIEKLEAGGVTYDLRDATAVHTVDSALSSSSTNPVQNKVIYQAIENVKTGPYISITIAWGVYVVFHNFSTSVPTTYSTLVAHPDFQVAITRTIVVDGYGTGTMAQGLLFDPTGTTNSNHWKILLPDGVVFNGALTNGVEGDVTYAEGDGWFLDNVDMTLPSYKTYTDGALQALDFSLSPTADQTLTAITQSDGCISATASPIAITSDQVTANATETTMPATGDGLIFADSSDSNKLKRMTVGLDTNETTKYLRQDGTWATPSTSSDTTYTFTGGTQSFTATPSSGTAQTVAIKPQIFKGTCESSASATTKVVTCPEFTSTDFVTGAIVFVTFTATNSGAVASLKLNVNSTGAKNIKYMRNAAESDLPAVGYLRANMTYRFVYNGSYWVCDTDYDADVLAYRLRHNSSNRVTSSYLGRYRIMFTSADNTKWVPSNASSATDATTARTVTSTKIDPFGEIALYYSTTAVSSGAKPGATAIYTMYAISLGYSFNLTGEALTLTNPAPVYIKCAPQDDGSAIIDSTTPYVQELPSTADGKIYIYLGHAYSATAVELMPNHPVYYYKSGAGIRLWTGVDPAEEDHTHVSTDIEAGASEVTAIATGDSLIFVDNDDSNKLKRMAYGFNTTNTTNFLRQDGSWATPPSGSNTTYTFADGTNGFTVTPSDGTAQTVNVTPSISTITNDLTLLKEAAEANTSPGDSYSLIFQRGTL